MKSVYFFFFSTGVRIREWLDKAAAAFFSRAVFASFNPFRQVLESKSQRGVRAALYHSDPLLIG